MGNVHEIVHYNMMGGSLQLMHIAGIMSRLTNASIS